MKRKLEQIKEYLAFATGLAFTPFISLYFYLAHGFPKEAKDFCKKNKTKLIRAGIAVLLILAYILGTGLTIVRPQTVAITWFPQRVGPFHIYEEPVVYVNDTGKLQFYLSWPRIPWVPGIGRSNIGAKESHQLKESIEISFKTELICVANITGNPEDANKFLCVVASGTGEVTDWNKFLSPNWESAFWELKFYPALAKEKDARPLQSFKTMLQTDIESYYEIYLNQEFLEYVNRTYYAYGVADAQKLTTAQDIENFIKIEQPWYWALGPLCINWLYEQSYRNSSFEDSGIAAVCFQAESAEKNIAYYNANLPIIEYKKENLIELFGKNLVEKAQSIVEQYKEFNRLKGEEFLYGSLEGFKEYLRNGNYSAEEQFVIRAIFDLEREKEIDLDMLDYYKSILEACKNYFTSAFENKYQSEGNAALWRAAIENALTVKSENGFDLARTDSYFSWFRNNFGEYFGEVLSDRLSDPLEANYGVKLNLTFEVKEIEKAQK